MEFKDKDAVNKVLTKIYEGILDVGPKKAEELIKKLGTKGDTALSEEMHSEIKNKLELIAEVEPDGVIEKLKEVDQQIRKTITELAKSKVSSGLLFEYNRINQSKTFFMPIIKTSFF